MGKFLQKAKSYVNQGEILSIFVRKLKARSAKLKESKDAQQRPSTSFGSQERTFLQNQQFIPSFTNFNQSFSSQKNFLFNFLITSIKVLIIKWTTSQPRNK